MFVEAAKVTDIVVGGMKPFSAGGKTVIVCNYREKFYAVSCNCGHLNAPLASGTLDGWIVTCPAHFAQFDVRTGEALCGPVPPDTAHETKDLQVFSVKIEDGIVWVEV
jgi:3-phenylpropionate/trans-cinnamate dioxygenase ferredoxin subunit